MGSTPRFPEEKPTPPAFRELGFGAVPLRPTDPAGAGPSSKGGSYFTSPPNLCSLIFGFVLLVVVSCCFLFLVLCVFFLSCLLFVWGFFFFVTFACVC